MITVEEATQIIQSKLLRLGVEEIELQNSLNRILAEDLIADRDFPPYDRVTMDGIAIQGKKYTEGNRKFQIQELCAAGDTKCTLNDTDACIEIMTGAILPENADTIIRYEDLQIDGDTATIAEINFRTGQNVHRRGSDHPAGKILVKKGSPISSAEIGIAASVGKAQVLVQQRPKIAVISSGDELVEIYEIPKEHQIRKSNVIQMQMSLERHYFQSESFHIIDDYNMIVKKLRETLSRFDVLILSGGVSKGKKDFIPAALEEIGIVKSFHRVAQRPGKPFWFGTSESQKFVFALPGNPVSSFMCMYNYVLPWLKMCQGIKPGNDPYVELNESINFKPDLTYFVPVKIEHTRKGIIKATPSLGNGSGDFANLLHGDGFVELPKGQDQYQEGTAFKFISYR
jgi:molybdopterin molybdotransferase